MGHSVQSGASPLCHSCQEAPMGHSVQSGALTSMLQQSGGPLGILIASHQERWSSNETAQMMVVDAI